MTTEDTNDADRSVPSSIGRFLVLERIEDRGEGSVYAAFDPELERRVALKVAHESTATDDDDSSPLLDEARALARLAHPNVIEIYDLGVIDDLPYVAMAFVEGPTLSAWLKAAARTPSEILNVYRQIGSGLVAAHDAGLAHRHFSSDNILVDSTGRPHLLEGGFSSASSQSSQARGKGKSTRAKRGTFFGRKRIDRELQRAFCASLHQALYGKTSGDEPTTMTQRRTAPLWIRAVLKRGTDDDPERRFSSMETLVDALSSPPRFQRWIGSVSVLAVVSIFAVALLVTVTTRKDSEPSCTGAPEKIERVWNRAAQERLASLFAASNAKHAKTTQALLQTELDRYAGTWTTIHHSICVESRLEEPLTADLMDVQMACLDERLRGLDSALESILELPAAEAVDYALDEAYGLAPVASCRRATRESGDTKELSPAVRGAILQTIDRASKLERIGDADAARLAAEAAVAEARSTHSEELIARALRELGNVQHSQFAEQAADTLVASARSAELARADELLAEIWTTLVGVQATRNQPEQALATVEVARGVINRVGSTPLLEARLANNYGAALANLGRHDEALEQYDQAIKGFEKSVGKNHPEIANSIHNKAQVYLLRGEEHVAARLIERSLELTEAAYGFEHPRVAELLAELASTLVARDLKLEARDAADRARSIFSRREERSAAEFTLALVYDTLGDRATADELMAEALPAVVAQQEQAPKRTFHGYQTLGRLAHNRENYQECLDSAQKALDVARDHGFPGLQRFDAEQLRADCLFYLERYRDALDIYQSLVAVAEQNEATLLSAVLLSAVGWCHLELKQPQLAIAPLERAVATFEPLKELQWQNYSEAAWLLAQVLWTVEPERSRSVELAKAAASRYAQSPEWRETSAEISAWLRTHRPPRAP